MPAGLAAMNAGSGIFGLIGIFILSGIAGPPWRKYEG
jgi:hypothetical protein